MFLVKTGFEELKKSFKKIVKKIFVDHEILPWMGYLKQIIFHFRCVDNNNCEGLIGIRTGLLCDKATQTCCHESKIKPATPIHPVGQTINSDDYDGGNILCSSEKEAGYR